MANFDFARFRRSFIALAILCLLVVSFLVFNPSDTFKPDTSIAISQEKVAGVNSDVLLYVYYEQDDAKRNLQFFVDHALHDRMDFIFIIQGDTLTVEIPTRPNIQVIHRENNCYDLGAIGSILFANDNAVRKKYKRFVLMNSSVRGPFFPYWAQQQGICWSNLFLKPLSNTTKMVGITANCDSAHPQHIQSMLFAVDSFGLELIEKSLHCANNRQDAIDHGETLMTSLVRESGYQADTIYSWRGNKKYSKPEEYWEQCDHGDVYYPGGMAGMDVHPFDTVFVKLRRAMPDRDPVTAISHAGEHIIATLTQWADDSHYSSYDYC